MFIFSFPGILRNTILDIYSTLIPERLTVVEIKNLIWYYIWYSIYDNLPNLNTVHIPWRHRTDGIRWIAKPGMTAQTIRNVTKYTLKSNFIQSIIFTFLLLMSVAEWMSHHFRWSRSCNAMRLWLVLDMHRHLKITNRNIKVTFSFDPV
jgi:hypothetical protein